MSSFYEHLESLRTRGLLGFLDQNRRGIEKESLRVTRDGRLSLSTHPAGLGAPLTHPGITTDFSESLLELITPAERDLLRCLDQLSDIQRYVCRVLDERDEVMWAGSMPCELPEDSAIPIAEYGSSRIAHMKTVYRRGLAWRYGRKMQTIAGIHYNFSPPAGFWEVWAEETEPGIDASDLRSEAYFRLIRNFRRHVWLLTYLFGASPALDASFLDRQDHGLERFDTRTWYLPHATSLRMSGLGYQNNAQSAVNVCYNTLPSYLSSLRWAISTPEPAYTRIGVEVDGEYRQLNDSILQIENEYYSVIRPKHTLKPGERPLRVLADQGVEYVEVRCVDLNPFVPLGIDAQQAHFLDLFLWYCLLSESPPIDDDTCARIARNQNEVVLRGRDPELRIMGDNGELILSDAANLLLDDLELLSETSGVGDPEILSAQRAKVENPELTPSGRILQTMRAQKLSHQAFCHDLSQQHAQWMREPALSPEAVRRHQDMAETSIAKRREIEANDHGSFEELLVAYFRQ